MVKSTEYYAFLYGYIKFSKQKAKIKHNTQNENYGFSNTADP
jgi:hypothetical protein